jgi:hypothetical protein
VLSDSKSLVFPRCFEMSWKPFKQTSHSEILGELRCVHLRLKAEIDWKR